MFLKSSKTDAEKTDMLYRTYSNQLFYYIKKIIKDEYSAEDVLQNTFILVFRNIDKIKDVDSEMTKSYLYTIARNAAFQHYNKTKKQAAVTIPYDENIIILDEISVMESIANAAASEYLDEYLMLLTEEDREILSLKYGHELDYGQISEILDIKNAAARQRLSRAKKRLAAKMKNDIRGR